MGQIALRSAPYLAALLLLGSILGVVLPRASGDHSSNDWSAPALVEPYEGYALVPQVAFDAQGNAVAVWVVANGSFGGSVGASGRWRVEVPDAGLWGSRYSRPDGWETPTLIASGSRMGEPALAVDSAGNAIVVWGSEGGAWANHFNPEIGWEPPIRLSAGEPSFAFSPRVVMNRLGNALAVWKELSPVINRPIIYASHLVAGNSWDTPTILGGSRRAGPMDVALDPYGASIVVWQHSDRVVAIRSVPGSGWDKAEISPFSEEDIWGPRVAVDHDGKAVVTWSTGPSIWARSFVPNDGWGEPVLIGEHPDGILTPQVSFDAKGNALVAWASHLRVNVGMALELYVSRYTQGVGWGLATRIHQGLLTEAQGPSTFSLGSGPSGETFVAWQNRTGLVTVMRYVAGAGWSSERSIGEGKYGWAYPIALAVDSEGSAVAVWVKWTEEVKGDGSNYRSAVFASAFSLPLAEILQRDLAETEEALEATQRELQELRGDLTATQDALSEASTELQVTRNELGGTRADLDGSMSAFAGLQSQFLVMLGLQAIFVTSTAILIVMYWNLRSQTSLKRSATRGSLKARRSEPLGRILGLPIGAQTSSYLGTSSKIREEGVRWPATGGPLRLTAKERVLLHLLDAGSRAYATEAPRYLTQNGISSVVGFDQRHFAQYVRPLISEGLIQERTAHIEGALQKRKVYALTMEGERKGLGIRGRIRSAVVSVRDASGVAELTIGDILAEFGRTRSILEIVHEAIEEGSVNLGQ